MEWFSALTFNAMDSKKRMLVLIISFITSQIIYGQHKSKGTDSAQGSFTVARLCPVSYPKKAEEHNIQGTVVVQFDIDSTCSYVNVNVVKSLGYGCDEEAVKAIKNCKRGYTKGKPDCIPIHNLLQTFVFSKPKEE
jgi:TonB family protein